MRKILLWTSILWALALPSRAQVTLNYTFTSGTTISAAEVNDNFNRLATYAFNRSSGTMAWHLLFATDNLHDIGASGASRPRDLFLGRNAVIGGTLGVTGVTTLGTGNLTTLNVSGVTTLGTSVSWGGGASLTSSSNVALLNAANAFTGGPNSATGTSGSTGWTAKVTGDTNPRIEILNDGALYFGPGNAGVDVNLYRDTGSTLKTDDSLVIAGGFTRVMGTSPARDFYESDAGADLKYWRHWVDGSVFKLQTLTDAYGSPSDVVAYDRSGNTAITGTIKERGRSTALGEWTTPTYAAGDFTANGSMTWTVQAGDVTTYAYALVGKMETVAFTIITSTVGGTPNNELMIKVPSGTAAKQVFNAVAISDNGSLIMGFAYVNSGGSQINVRRSDGANWSASTDNTIVRGQITFPIQ